MCKLLQFLYIYHEYPHGSYLVRNYNAAPFLCTILCNEMMQYAADSSIPLELARWMLWNFWCGHENNDKLGLTNKRKLLLNQIIFYKISKTKLSYAIYIYIWES
jgi:hypothetical protein